jgi:hypothetical protein
MTVFEPTYVSIFFQSRSYLRRERGTRGQHARAGGGGLFTDREQSFRFCQHILFS